MQGESEVITNEFGTNFSVQIGEPPHMPHPGCSLIVEPKYDWSFALANTWVGLTEWKDGSTTVGWGNHLLELPFSAPTIAWTSAGLSIALIILAVLARRRWRRG